MYGAEYNKMETTKQKILFFFFTHKVKSSKTMIRFSDQDISSHSHLISFYALAVVICCIKLHHSSGREYIYKTLQTTHRNET